MANEKRLIDANALIALVKKNTPYLYHMIAPMVALCCPTVEAVEVVRCKDCDKSKRSPVFGDGWRFCKNNQQHHRDDHFCSYGERREGE